MRQRATRQFWEHYNTLPPENQRLADVAYELLKADARHPSLQVKKVGNIGLFASDFITGYCRSKKGMIWFGSGLATTGHTTE